MVTTTPQITGTELSRDDRAAIEAALREYAALLTRIGYSGVFQALCDQENVETAFIDKTTDLRHLAWKMEWGQ